ncbi:hypothetical protein [Idiomarina sp.]|uniref:DUF3846 domain-containing protein n=1 Tax=Idiomarina sp. TaxID=1874361 RepID=UPI000C417B94|nr:hypothetical protein [Idiomarina sp.]MAO66860.1 hypothetical protein [Idiomarina sp.]|tara:strand:+ start:464 stop:808 length:345 start_codon:yes stop_codon:yes gene_type:complete
MKAILINPFDTTIKEVVYTGNFREIYDFIDCRTFDCVSLDNEDDMYLDDEGLLVNNQRFFSIKGGNYGGKALLLSHDDEGESTATTLTLQEVEDMVQWLPEGHKEEPYMEFIAL